VGRARVLDPLGAGTGRVGRAPLHKSIALPSCSVQGHREGEGVGWGAVGWVAVHPNVMPAVYHEPAASAGGRRVGQVSGFSPGGRQYKIRYVIPCCGCQVSTTRACTWWDIAWFPGAVVPVPTGRCGWLGGPPCAKVQWQASLHVTMVGRNTEHCSSRPNPVLACS
jgi:hypothetical protein